LPQKYFMPANIIIHKLFAGISGLAPACDAGIQWLIPDQAPRLVGLLNT